ncbi:hypothetical protein H5410_036424 [Solanum commersonii]|uniref:Uncharacterized protein n=1 Tax=Solanum commersonii TaxID=4109 RepID=A0A9J5Y6G8_SOLCO|nr:hypothetical protein H5410_036424 [Solanum commersonii]
MQRKDPEITNNETIHILTFRAHFQISALLFPSSGNHRMIHKKGGRIRTYGRTASTVGLGGRVSTLALSLCANRCALPGLTLSPLLLFWLCHYQSRVTPGPAASDLRRTIIPMTKQGSASYFSSGSSTIPTSNFLGIGASKLAQPRSCASGMNQLDLVSPNHFAILEDPEQKEAKCGSGHFFEQEEIARDECLGNKAEEGVVKERTRGE